MRERWDGRDEMREMRDGRDEMGEMGWDRTGEMR